jgi:hypothetical protein
MKGIDQRLAAGDNGVDHQLMAALGTVESGNQAHFLA